MHFKAWTDYDLYFLIKTPSYDLSSYKFKSTTVYLEENESLFLLYEIVYDEQFAKKSLEIWIQTIKRFFFQYIEEGQI